MPQKIARALEALEVRTLQTRPKAPFSFEGWKGRKINRKKKLAKTTLTTKNKRKKNCQKAILRWHFFRQGNQFFISYLSWESFKITGPKKLVESIV